VQCCPRWDGIYAYGSTDSPGAAFFLGLGSPAKRLLFGGENLAQLEHLVAQGGGLLKLQVAGRVLHLEVQILRHAEHIVAGHRLSGHLIGGLVIGHPEAIGDVVHRLLDAFRFDVVGLAVRVLDLPAAVGLVDGLLHRMGDPVGVHDGVAFRALYLKAYSSTNLFYTFCEKG